MSKTGNALKSYDQSSGEWTTLPDVFATNVAVGKGGELYTINNKGEVWLYHPQGRGVQLSPPGVKFANQISVGPDGTVWITSLEPRQGGNVVMWWSGQNEIWNSVPPPAAAVDVAGAVQ